MSDEEKSKHASELIDQAIGLIGKEAAAKFIAGQLQDEIVKAIDASMPEWSRTSSQALVEIGKGHAYAEIANKALNIANGMLRVPGEPLTMQMITEASQHLERINEMPDEFYDLMVFSSGVTPGAAAALSEGHMRERLESQIREYQAAGLITDYFEVESAKVREGRLDVIVAPRWKAPAMSFSVREVKS